MNSLRTKAKFLLVTILSFFTVATHAHARLGETHVQCIDRYGSALADPATKQMDKMLPLLEGAIHYTFVYQGWKIRAAFLELDGPAVRIDYQKVPAAGVNPMIQDYEIAAILESESLQGNSWTRVAYDNPNSPNQGIAKAMEPALMSCFGAKAWRRGDGASAQLPSGLLLRLELPAAQEQERQLKIQKEQRARASVPKF